jgi:hypothetical protein
LLHRGLNIFGSSPVADPSLHRLLLHGPDHQIQKYEITIKFRPPLLRRPRSPWRSLCFGAHPSRIRYIYHVHRFDCVCRTTYFHVHSVAPDEKAKCFLSRELIIYFRHTRILGGCVITLLQKIHPNTGGCAITLLSQIYSVTW